MSLLRRAIEQASAPEDAAAAQAVAVLSQAPQEAAQFEHFSTDPISGYDAAQIALRLFEGGFLGEFSDYLKEKNLSPNIILANGLTLLQNSLMQFPKDTGRVNCLLDLGANPNLFMRRNDEKGFGRQPYRAGYHPLNYAFANSPQLVAPEICTALRKYGASVEGIKYRMEVDPDLAVPDDEIKVEMRRKLVTQTPDPKCTKVVRADVDLSVMQRELANIETQLAAAGFQVVSYVPPKQAPAQIELTPENIGETIGDKGVYVGTWEPKNRNGKSLGKKFNVFAAPEDLTDASGKKVLLMYKDAAKEVGKLRGWNGHDGGNYDNDTALYKALGGDGYKGEWFIPPKELLDGKKDIGGNKVQNDTLYDAREKGDFDGTFQTTEGSDDARWYWSCTEHRDNPDLVLIVRFSDGDDYWGHKDNYRLSCRPCRVELIL